MKPTVPLPHKLEFKDWAEKFCANYPNLNMPLPRKNQHWSDWAGNLMSVQDFRYTPTPVKNQYGEDWQKWAILMINRIGEKP